MEDGPKFCGRLRISELYVPTTYDIKVCDSMGSEYRKSGHLRNTIQWIIFLAFTFLKTDSKEVKKPLRFRKT